MKFFSIINLKLQVAEKFFCKLQIISTAILMKYVILAEN